MAAQEKSKIKLFGLLKGAYNTLLSYPVILFPFCVIAFVQLTALEILYFAPRYPLSTFFGPMIRNLWSETFLHYPYNLVLLPKMFHHIQKPIFIFVSSYFIAVAISMVSAINSGNNPTMKKTMKEILPKYVHVLAAALLFYLTYMGIAELYSLAVNRAAMIRSTSGLFWKLKVLIIDGAPYFNLLMGIFVTALFAFVIPIIVIENKKILGALISNFKDHFKSLFFVFFVVFFPTIFYLPVLILRNNIGTISDLMFPEIRFWVLVLSVIIMVFIDAIAFTATTTYYLIKREES